MCSSVNSVGEFVWAVEAAKLQIFRLWSGPSGRNLPNFGRRTRQIKAGFTQCDAPTHPCTSHERREREDTRVSSLSLSVAPGNVKGTRVMPPCTPNHEARQHNAA